MKFSFNQNKFKSKFDKVTGRHDIAVEMALGSVGLAILQDINDKEPKPPFETGFLRGSQFLYVNGQKVNVPTKAKNLPGVIEYDPSTIEVSVGLNTPYARKMHELLGVSMSPRKVSQKGTKKDTSGVGGKFLEAKLEAYKDRYARIFAEEFVGFLND